MPTIYLIDWTFRLSIQVPYVCNVPPFFPLVLRAKLAEWLASKGKALKRPPIASTLPQTASRPAPSKPLPKPEAVAVAAQNPEAEPVARQDSDLETQRVERPQSSPEAEAKPETETPGVPATAPCSSSSADIMNTTLDLLENSEMDLPVDPEPRMDDVRKDFFLVPLF